MASEAEVEAAAKAIATLYGYQEWKSLKDDAREVLEAADRVRRAQMSRDELKLLAHHFGNWNAHQWED